MPLASYDWAFGGKKGSATKAHAAMVSHYGAKRGDRVFYSLVADRRKGGLVKAVRRGGAKPKP